MNNRRLLTATIFVVLPALLVTGRALPTRQESKVSGVRSAVDANTGRKKAGTESASMKNFRKKAEADRSVNEDLMSPMGRIAHMVATGRMARMIERAKIRMDGSSPGTGKTKRHGAALGMSATFVDDGEEDDEEDGDQEDGPAGGQAELSIAVDSTGQHIVVGNNDTRGFALNPASVSGFAYSDDGGATFVDGGQLPINTGTSNIGATILPQVFGDPEVKFVPGGAGGQFIYFSIMIKKFSATTTAQTMCVHRSTDFGHTWTGPFEVIPATNPNGLLSGASPRDAADKELADVDPDTGRVIMSWSNFTPAAPGGVQISTTFSDDMFTATPPTWSARKTVAGTSVDGQGSVPRFAGNGSPNAYIAWTRFPGGINQNVGFARSTDNGATWSAPVNATSNFRTMDQVLGNDRVNTNASLAVDNSTGINAGNVYAVYSNNNNNDGADIAFQRSTDGGLTFSTPILLNSRLGADRPQWFPYLTVDKNTGRVDAFYLDQGIDTSGDLTETTHVFSNDGGVTWSKPMPLTDRPFRAGFGNDTGQPNLGDYNQAVAQGGELFVVWAGTEQKDFPDGQPTSASMTTPDIFFKRVSTAKAALSLGAVTFTDGNANGFIDAGEQVSFNLPLKNYVTNPLSQSTVTGISGTLSSPTTGVSVTQAASSYANIAAGGSAANATPYVIQLAANFVPGTHIELSLNVSTSQGSTTLLSTQSTGTPGASLIFGENFNSTAVGSLPAGWVSQHGGGANTVNWITNNALFGTTSNAAFHANANDGVGGTGNPVRTERLLSPLITIPATAQYVTLDFDVAYNTEDEPLFNIQAYDGLVFRFVDFTPGRVARNVLAEAFAEEFTTGTFNHYPKHFPRSSNASYFQDMSAWAGNSNGFKHVHMKLPGMAGSLIQLRWEFTQDTVAICATPPCGVMVDNVVLNSVVTVQADLSVTKSASPDPVLSGSNITYTIDAKNNGPSTSNLVTVSDSTPANTTFVSASGPAGWTLAMSPAGGGTGAIKFTKASMAANETAQFTIVVNVNCPTPDGTKITNTTSISSADTLTPDNDSSNNSSTKMVTVSNPAPVITNESVSQAVLWPPNHKLVDITVNYTVTDNCGTPVCVLTAVSNEPDNGLGDGDTANDIQIVDNHHVRLRAERSGTGTGRIYTITIRCTDSGGGVSTKTVTVTVPHDEP